jgi:hypothetical protein
MLAAAVSHDSDEIALRALGLQLWGTNAARITKTPPAGAREISVPLPPWSSCPAMTDLVVSHEEER